MQFFYRGYSPVEAGGILLMGKLRAKVARVVGGK
jgi:hypothetical protein